MDWPGKFRFAGSKFVYNRLYSGLETLYSTGPINETLEIQVNKYTAILQLQVKTNMLQLHKTLK